MIVEYAAFYFDILTNKLIRSKAFETNILVKQNKWDQQR